MPVTAIVGAQWGDEGKGKITDLLAQKAEVVVRFGGGGNAGHTVVNEYGKFALHSIPSGIFNPRAMALIGTGAVVDFTALTDEVAHVEAGGVSTAGLRISSRAQVVMPYHILLDRLAEEARGGAAIGTTGRGIGPTYVDKAERIGIQAGDILDPDVFRQKLEFVVSRKNRILQEIYHHPPLDIAELESQCREWRARFSGRIVDQVVLVAEALRAKKSVLLEGQLGAMRDLDWGTYPFVTSSTTIAGGGAVGGGFPVRTIERVLGVVKAYTTAVGAGPLPTELDDEIGSTIREVGAEFGATTGRPRRVGWFDAVAARYACDLNGFTGVAVTKLDVLDSLPSLKICVAYRLDGERLDSVPLTPALWRVTPEYETLPGWQQSTTHARSWNELPATARQYLERIADLTGAPIEYVSVGPAREQTIEIG